MFMETETRRRSRGTKTSIPTALDAFEPVQMWLIR
jgi:hypothetical protein